MKPWSYIVLFPAVVWMGVFLFSCGSKGSSESSQKGSDKSQSAGATAGQEVSSGTGQADIQSATGALGKKEVVFRVPVVAQRVVRGEMKGYLSTRGTLSPEEQILVRAEISGKLTFSKPWNEGDQVEKGDLIATIDNEDVRYAKQEALKNLRLAEERLPSAEEKLKLAERNYAAKKRLFDEGVISQLDYDQAEVQKMDAQVSYHQALAEVESRKTDLEKVKYKQDRALIVAPFDGTLVRKEYLERQQQGIQTSYPIMSLHGRTVNAGEAILGIIKTSRMRLEVDISSKDVAKVQPGQMAEIHVYGGEVMDVTGVVEKISTALDPQTRAFQVTISVDNPDGRLKSGMFCKVDIVVERQLDTIAVAKEIVQTRSNRKIVFVVQGEPDQEQAQEREVKLGISNRYDVEIVEGLHEGDFLIVRGYETLKDKTKVKMTKSDEDQAEASQQTVSERASSS